MNQTSNHADAPSADPSALGTARGRVLILWHRYRIELIATISVVLISAVVFRLVLGPVRTVPLRAQGMQAGAKISAPGNYDWKAHPGTILLAVKVGCTFCESNLPFYQTLIAHQKSGRLRPHLLVLFPDSGSQIRKSYGDVFSGADFMSSVDFGRYGVALTPTLALVDRNGIARQVWLGALASDQQNALLQAVEPEQTCKDSATPCKN